MPAGKGFSAYEALSRLVVGFQMAPDGAHRRVWSELGPWFRALAMNAAPKWLPRMAMNFPCHIVATEPRPTPCANSAVATCFTCKRPTCLAHSFVNVEGEVICYSCVTRMAGGPKPAPENAQDPHRRKQELASAREVLGVGPRAGWNTIHRAYRKKAAAAHPDRGGDQEEFRKVQKAYDLLKEDHERRNHH